VVTVRPVWLETVDAKVDMVETCTAYVVAPVEVAQLTVMEVA
jgi:hypothetical protein